MHWAIGTNGFAAGPAVNAQRLVLDVQEGIGGTGITTYRQIKFECESCGNVTLEITAGPTAGFGAPSFSEPVHPNHDPTAGLSPSEGAL